MARRKYQALVPSVAPISVTLKKGVEVIDVVTDGANPEAVEGLATVWQQEVGRTDGCLQSGASAADDEYDL